MSACGSVVAIAQQLSHASVEQNPIILLALNNVVQGDKWSAKEKELARRQIWKCDLLHIIVEVLRQDFTLVPGQWDTAAKLANLLSNVCVGLKPKLSEQQNASGESCDQITEYYDILLPTAVDSLLILTTNLMELATAHVAKNDPLPHFLTVADALSWLCSNQQPCVQRALQSPYLLNILISDEAAYSGIALQFMAKMLEQYPGFFSVLPRDTMQSVMDELVYKISSADHQSALPALDLLGALVEKRITQLDNLMSRYKGLNVIILRWGSHQLGTYAARLVGELETRAASDQKAARINSAAVLIQALWRGYACRKKMKRMRNGICKFQQVYRRWKSRKDQTKEAGTRATRRLPFTAQREFQERQIATLELIPACEVDAFFKRQEEQAASKIQAWWKGAVARRAFVDRKAAALKTKSATVIQRAVRKYFQRQKKRMTTECCYPALSPEERDVLLQEVQQMMERQSNIQSIEQKCQLHNQVQELLRNFYANLESSRRRDDQRRVLLARLTEDSNQALSAPQLHNASDELVELFTSGSTAVANMAQVAHREELKAMQLPWWKKWSLDDGTLPLDDSITDLLS